jgi:hypothetical protein
LTEWNYLPTLPKYRVKGDLANSVTSPPSHSTVISWGIGVSLSLAQRERLRLKASLRRALTLTLLQHDVTFVEQFVV